HQHKKNTVQSPFLKWSENCKTVGKQMSMKTTSVMLGMAFMAVAATACNNNRARYLDLATGDPVELREDSTSGLLVSNETGKPVKLYVDTKTNDTVYGRTGKVVNGHLLRTKEGKYEYEDGTVVKIDGEEYKAKKGDTKVKYEDGDYKMKEGSYTKKVDEDGDIKIEDGKTQVKIDGETGERKVKKDKNITDKIKKIFH
ncbi:MAG TPA: hypothetical protein VHK91_17505, partial [Flavisolibacter sp.]|nr:hypothetical protein [Flavisolibacter sp.]